MNIINDFKAHPKINNDIIALIDKKIVFFQDIIQKTIQSLLTDVKPKVLTTPDIPDIPDINEISKMIALSTSAIADKKSYELKAAINKNPDSGFYNYNDLPLLLTVEDK